ncbi:MAG: nucleotide exchange factor GrpE [Chitinophagaceae bacterium]|nr:nucleotide exchange factor GrpE [Anaerolineae bacterium]
MSKEDTVSVTEGVQAPDEVTASDQAPPVQSAAEPQPVDTSSQEIQALKDEVEKNLQGWQRTLADFQNYKRRVEREQKDLHQKTTLDTLVKVLPMFDDFERALANVPPELEGNPWMNGVSLILNKFLKLLDESEVTIIDPVGQQFDPSQHEAVGRDEDSDFPSGTVTATLQKGYLSGERVLRPALVKVAG